MARNASSVQWVASFSSGSADEASDRHEADTPAARMLPNPFAAGKAGAGGPPSSRNGTEELRPSLPGPEVLVLQGTAPSATQAGGSFDAGAVPISLPVPRQCLATPGRCTPLSERHTLAGAGAGVAGRRKASHSLACGLIGVHETVTSLVVRSVRRARRNDPGFLRPREAAEW